MRSLPFLLAAGTFLLAASCVTTTPAVTTATTAVPQQSSWQPSLRQWGTLHSALHDGEDHGRIAVADAARPGIYGVGALAGLRGEISILDGEVWISEGRAGDAVTTRDAASAQATVLFVAQVAEWIEVVVEQDVPPSRLDSYLAERAHSVGLDPSRPFPFLVRGALSQLRMHVIGGECPIRARMSGAEPTRPAYERHFAAPFTARLVGIYAPDSAGVVCHRGSRSHSHVVLEEEEGGELTGHVEAVGIAAGALLSLPRR